ncbi:hypothetical protein [Streptomyces chartreusis]|uniref:hypothetical protein n=1 Tax=Streptomyces chartreusis TaxID=1969 RepID=UPI00123C901F|nr:hypothetical protein [Streptomyces chartreusis]QEV65264.1 hypothetical protein CP983_00045 [Streptomyces chartreusis]GGW91020.1 hypothetical protein GCM10010321_00100 [Streptomyces chartreusis]
MTAASYEVAVLSYLVAMPQKPLSRLEAVLAQMLDAVTHFARIRGLFAATTTTVDDALAALDSAYQEAS